jgi:hypothetical protein
LLTHGSPKLSQLKYFVFVLQWHLIVFRWYVNNVHARPNRRVLQGTDHLPDGRNRLLGENPDRKTVETMLGPQQNLCFGTTQKGQIPRRTFRGTLRVSRKYLVEFWLLLNPLFKCFDRIKCKNLSEKVFLISGDIQKPFLGLRVQDAELLKKETTCVIHAAANVKFDQTLKEASHNVRATRDVLELAKHMPNLKVSSKAF